MFRVSFLMVIIRSNFPIYTRIHPNNNKIFKDCICGLLGMSSTVIKVLCFPLGWWGTFSFYKFLTLQWQTSIVLKMNVIYLRFLRRGFSNWTLFMYMEIISILWLVVILQLVLMNVNCNMAKLQFLKNGNTWLIPLNNVIWTL